jgi:serine/threonine protein kinase
MTCKMQASLRIVWAIGALTFEVLTGNRPFGAGYKAVPLIQAAKVPPLPRPLTSNTQFAPFATAIFDLIRACMQKDPAVRPTADQLVRACEGLYYSTVPPSRRAFPIVKVV